MKNAGALSLFLFDIISLFDIIGREQVAKRTDDLQDMARERQPDAKRGRYQVPPRGIPADRCNNRSDTKEQRIDQLPDAKTIERAVRIRAAKKLVLFGKIGIEHH